MQLANYIEFKNGKKRPKDGGIYPVYGGNGILDYSNEYNAEGCIIIGRVGAYCGSVYLSNEKCWVSDNAIIAMPKNNADLYFIYYLLKSLNLNAMHIGSGQPLITQDILNRIEANIPEYNLQIKVASILSVLDAKIEENKRINKNLLEQVVISWHHLRDAEDWPHIAVADIAEKVAMGPFGSNIKVSTFVPSGIPIISGNHLRGYFLEEPEFNYIAEDHAEKLRNSNVYPRDIVFTHAGNIGQVAMIPKCSKYPRYVLSQRQFYLRCNEAKAIPEYVLFFFHSAEGQHELLSYANQTGVPSIAQPATNLKKIELPLPPLSEQTSWYSQISPLLDAYMGNRQENDCLTLLRDSLMPRLMSGELDVSNIDL